CGVMSWLAIAARASRYLLTATQHSQVYTLSLHDALPIWMRSTGTPSSRPCRGRASSAGRRRNSRRSCRRCARARACMRGSTHTRSEEHTSELQSHLNLVCRLLLEEKIEDSEPDVNGVRDT